MYVFSLRSQHSCYQAMNSPVCVATSGEASAPPTMTSPAVLFFDRHKGRHHRLDGGYLERRRGMEKLIYI